MSFVRILKEIFSKKKYLFMVFFIAIFFYSINIVFSSWEAFSEFSSDKSFFGTIKLFFFLFFKIEGINNIYSRIGLIVISILFGILFSLIFYKTKQNMSGNKKSSSLGVVGIFLMAFIPGCAACGIGIIPILGLGTGFLYLLPFKGLGLSVLSILILSFAIFKIAKDMNKCKISDSFIRNENRIERRYNIK